MKLFWSFYLSLSEGSLSCHSAQQCSPNASIPVSLCISIHKASSSLLLPSTLEILNNVQKFHFIAQVMVLFEDSDCLGASQVKYLPSAEIVVRWKAGPLLLLLQTKAEILMDFDFPDTSLGLDWYKQPKLKLSSVCLFVGWLFVLVWFGLGFFVCKPSHEQCLCYQHWIPTCLFLRISALKISGQKNSLGVIVPAVGQEFGMPVCDVLVDAAHKELGMVMVFEFITELLWQWPSYSYLWIISFLSSVCSLFNQNKSHPTNTCLGPEIKYRQMIWFLGKHRMTGAALRNSPAAWREWQEHSTWNDSSARGF